jgi:hypothetical protein
MTFFDLRAVFCSIVALAWFASDGASADVCPAASIDPTTKLCTQLHAMHFDDVTIAQIGSVAPKPPNDDVPWIAQSGVAPPLAVNPGDTGVAIKTSIGQWRDFNSAMLARRIDVSRAINPGNVPLPKPPVITALPLDVWSSFDVQGLARDADETTKTGVGANYKLSNATRIGIAAERADQRSASGTNLQKIDKLAANMTYQASPHLSFDAKTQWETGSTVTTTGLGKTDKSSLILAPKLKYPIAVGGGQTFEPFVTMSEDLALNTSSSDPSKKAALSVGTGLTLSKPQAYSLSLTTDLEHVGASEPATVKSRFQLSVPLR